MLLFTPISEPAAMDAPTTAPVAPVGENEKRVPSDRKLKARVRWPPAPPKYPDSAALSAVSPDQNSVAGSRADVTSEPVALEMTFAAMPASTALAATPAAIRWGATRSASAPATAPPAKAAPAPAQVGSSLKIR